MEEKFDIRLTHRRVLPSLHVLHIAKHTAVQPQTSFNGPDYSRIKSVFAGWALTWTLSYGTTDGSTVLLALIAYLALGLCGICVLLQSLRIARLQPLLKVVECLGLSAGFFAVGALWVVSYVHQLSGAMPA